MCIVTVCLFVVCRELEKQGLKVFHKEKRSMKFMQKYRHKGVFYMVIDAMCGFATINALAPVR